jgi:hypothetical protein
MNCTSYRVETSARGTGWQAPQRQDQIVGNGRGHIAKGDQATHAQGGTNGGDQLLCSVSKRINRYAAEHGLDHLGQATATQFFHGDQGQPSLKTLAFEIFKRTLFLFGFGVDRVPEHKVVKNSRIYFDERL